MKIQKQLSKKRGDKKYYRYTVNLPEGVLNESGFKEGDELVADSEKGKIVLKKK